VDRKEYYYLQPGGKRAYDVAAARALSNVTKRETVMSKVQALSLMELNELLPRLQATIESLGHLTGQQPAKRVGRPPKAVAPKQVARSKNNPEESAELRERIVGYLKSTTKGAPTKQIANALKTDVAAVSYGLGVLRAKRKVRMTGARSTALYHAAK
jgi:hypothetical protein